MCNHCTNLFFVKYHAQVFSALHGHGVKLVVLEIIFTKSLKLEAFIGDLAARLMFFSSYFFWDRFGPAAVHHCMSVVEEFMGYLLLVLHCRPPSFIVSHRKD